MLGPIPPARDLGQLAAQSSRGVGLKIGKHPLRHCFTSYGGVHIRCPDMYRMSDPLPVLAYGANRLERNQSGLPFALRLALKGNIGLQARECSRSTQPFSEPGRCVP